MSFIDDLVARGGAARVDYVYGDDVLERLPMNGGHVDLHLATAGKGDLLRRAMREGPLPRKTFSMGRAYGKCRHVEARRFSEAGDAPAAGRSAAMGVTRAGLRLAVRVPGGG